MSSVVILVGGGSGGHITPLIAVARELKIMRPNLRLVFIGEQGGHFTGLISESHLFDAVLSVKAGKFRRYPGQKWWQKITDLPTVAKNSRDLTRIAKGYTQSRRILKLEQPAGVFIKGGFVGVPVGLAAAKLNIPIVTHDSDTTPGLANRIVGRWAKIHATGMPAKYYPIDGSKLVYTGIPIRPEFKPVNRVVSEKLKKELGLSNFTKVLLITGGSQGADTINRYVVAIAPELLRRFPRLAVIHIAGIKNEYAVKTAYKKRLKPELRSNIMVKGFIQDLYKYSAVADVIICRASATNLAEFALQGKACIVIPGDLADDHQTKNARIFEQSGAVRVVTENSLKHSLIPLLNEASNLLKNEPVRLELASNSAMFAVGDAAKNLAKLLLKAFDLK